MDPVAEVFAVFGDSPTRLARATGYKVQTVFDWKAKAPVNIPEWRRAQVLKAVRKTGSEITAETLAYLQCRPARPSNSQVAA